MDGVPRDDVRERPNRERIAACRATARPCVGWQVSKERQASVRSGGVIMPQV